MQFGDTLDLVVANGLAAELFFTVNITGISFSGTRKNRRCRSCVSDPTLTITGSFTNGTISGAVVDPIGGNFSFTFSKNS